MRPGTQAACVHPHIRTWHFPWLMRLGARRAHAWKRTGSPNSHSCPCSQYSTGAGTPTSSSGTCRAPARVVRRWRGPPRAWRRPATGPAGRAHALCRCGTLSVHGLRSAGLARRSMREREMSCPAPACGARAVARKTAPCHGSACSLRVPARSSPGAQGAAAPRSSLLWTPPLLQQTASLPCHVLRKATYTQHAPGESSRVQPTLPYPIRSRAGCMRRVPGGRCRRHPTLPYPTL